MCVAGWVSSIWIYDVRLKRQGRGVVVVVVDSIKHESDEYIDRRVANHPELETAAATTPRLPTLLASAPNHDTHFFSLSLASSR